MRSKICAGRGAESVRPSSWRTRASAPNSPHAMERWMFQPMESHLEEGGPVSASLMPWGSRESLIVGPLKGDKLGLGSPATLGRGQPAVESPSHADQAKPRAGRHEAFSQAQTLAHHWVALSLLAFAILAEKAVEGLITRPKPLTEPVCS